MFYCVLADSMIFSSSVLQELTASENISDFVENFLNFSFQNLFSSEKQTLFMYLGIN